MAKFWAFNESKGAYVNIFVTMKANIPPYKWLDLASEKANFWPNVYWFTCVSLYHVKAIGIEFICVQQRKKNVLHYYQCTVGPTMPWLIKYYAYISHKWNNAKHTYGHTYRGCQLLPWVQQGSGLLPSSRLIYLIVCMVGISSHRLVTCLGYVMWFHNGIYVHIVP